MENMNEEIVNIGNRDLIWTNEKLGPLSESNMIDFWSVVIQMKIF